MNKNIKVAKQLVKLAKSLIAEDKHELEDEYYDLQEETRNKMLEKFDDFINENFGTVNDKGYKITLVDYTFHVECGNKDIDEEIVRQLIREGKANERYNTMLRESNTYVYDDDEIEDMLVELAELSNQLEEKNDYDDPVYQYFDTLEEYEYLKQGMDFLPAQYVEVYKNGKYIENIPWTRNMWGGGAWG